MATGIVFHSTQPSNPLIGDIFIDQNTYQMWIWSASGWNKFLEKQIEHEPEFIPPTQEQLEKHPALKQAWDEFLVIKRLLGI